MLDRLFSEQSSFLINWRMRIRRRECEGQHALSILFTYAAHSQHNFSAFIETNETEWQQMRNNFRRNARKQISKVWLPTQLEHKRINKFVRLDWMHPFYSADVHLYAFSALTIYFYAARSWSQTTRWSSDATDAHKHSQSVGAFEQQPFCLLYHQSIRHRNMRQQSSCMMEVPASNVFYGDPEQLISIKR